MDARSLQPECARVLHESLLVLVLMHGSETKVRKEKELGLYRCTTLGVFLGISRIDRM